MFVDNPFRQAVLASFLALACAGGTLASATMKRDCPTPSKEDREKMAAAHEQMAACLRSDKSVAECHKELAATQHQMMQMMGCPSGRKMHPHGAPAPQTNPPNKS